jgi:two-component system OmpR family response regulator/two-component system alkaline phosphatase synthesis response regulator PhoP
MAATRVLVVEDEAHIRELVCLHLGLEGYECLQASDGQEALRVAGGAELDLIVLDLMIPAIDGLTVCRAVRRQGPNQDVPILMLTARREEADKVLGLESGADDYLAKPFGVRELIARCHALLRRARRTPREPAEAAGAPAARVMAVHGLEIDPAKRRVRVRGRDIDLTNQEFTLLLLFAEHPGIVFSRDALLEKIWKGETYVTERSVDTLVKRLRHKVEEDPANPALILTQWGVGYKFADV